MPADAPFQSIDPAAIALWKARGYPVRIEDLELIIEVEDDISSHAMFNAR